MDGAAIFELDLALLDPGFLDLELGKRRPRVARDQPSQSQRKKPEK